MAGIRGLFVRKSGVYGTTPTSARKDIAGLVASAAAFGARPGVLSGCVVSGTTSGWTYSVSAGHLVTVRSAADGAMPWGNDAATTVATSAAPVSGSRIDLITASHNDVDNGDADSDPVLGVVQGTAGSPGVAPSLPTGAIELGRCTLAAGAANTQGGTFSSLSVQYTSDRGAPIPVIGAPQRDALDGVGTMADPVRIYEKHTGLLKQDHGSGWYTYELSSPWATLSLEAGAAHVSGQGLSYRKVGDFWELRGGVIVAAGLTVSAMVLTSGNLTPIASTWGSSMIRLIGTGGSGTLTLLSPRSDGNLRVFASATTGTNLYLCFDGIRFRSA